MAEQTHFIQHLQSSTVLMRPDVDESDPVLNAPHENIGLSMEQSRDQVTHLPQVDAVKEENSCNKVWETIAKPVLDDNQEQCLEVVDKAADNFTCGVCSVSFSIICALHAHLLTHGSQGSYIFNHTTKMAYPKFEQCYSYVQTDVTMLEDSLRASEPIVNTAQETKSQEQNESPVKQRRGRKRKSEVAESVVNEKKPKGARKKAETNKGNTKETAKQSNDASNSEKKEIDQSQSGKGKGVKGNCAKKKILKDKITAKTVKRNQKSKEIKQENNVEIDTYIDISPGKKTGSYRKKVSKVETNDDKGAKDVMVIVTTDDTESKKPDNPDNVNKDEVEINPADLNIDDANDNEDTDTDETTGLANSGEQFVQYMTNNDEENIEKAKAEKPKPKIKNKVKTEPIEGAEKPIKVPKVPKEKKKREIKPKEDIYQSCEVCKEIIVQRRMKSHMLTHTSEKSFVCEICGQAYAKYSNLYRHKITHREVKPFCCTLCPAQFCRKKDYTYHLNSHKGYRPHVCNVCDMKFLTNKGLIQHQENIHMGVTKFQCDMCDRRFFKKSGLYAHRATHFEATLECQYCEKKFRDKCGLNKHERTHTGKKHYQCHVCGHAFNQCTPYYHHMEKKHSMDRASIKDIMKIVMEAKKRNGEKVDLFVVPKNLEEIVTNLKMEEKPGKPKVSYKFESMQLTPDQKLQSKQEVKSEGVAEQILNSQQQMLPPSSNILHQAVSESMLLPTQTTDSFSIVASENNNLSLSLQTLENVRPMKIYTSAQNLLELQSQSLQPAENMLSFPEAEQQGQSTALLNLEPVKNLIPSGGHPKQKMKLLSHYAEYHQQQKVTIAPIEHHLQQQQHHHHHQQQHIEIPMASKVDQTPISIAVPVYSQPGVTGVSLAGTGMESLPDAYGTSDFIDRILQGH